MNEKNEQMTLDEGMSQNKKPTTTVPPVPEKPRTTVPPEAKKSKPKAQQKPQAKAIDIRKGSVSGQFIKLLEPYKLQISQVLPKHLTVERLMQIASTVLTRNPDLYQCDPASIVGAVLESSILGLDPTPEFGLCYFVPYNNKKTHRLEAQFQLGYRGMITLAKRTGQISNIYSYVIHENDDYRIELGLNPQIIHIPNLTDPGKKILVYAVVVFKDGSKQFEEMTRKQVMGVKRRSPGASSPYSPWNTDPDSEEQMWRKTSLKRLLKFVPLSSEYRTAINADSTVIRPDSFTKDGLDLSKVERLEEEESEVDDDGSEDKSESLVGA